MNNIKNLCTWVIVFFIILGVIFGCIGFNKKNVYVNSEYDVINKNVYVGGDAYNFIINGTYFVGYSVLCGASFVISALFGVLRCYIVYDESKESIIAAVKQNDNEGLPPL